MGDGSSSPAEESAGAGGTIVEVASQRVTRLSRVLARRRPPTASPSSRRMPEPNTGGRNGHGSRVDEFRTAKLRGCDVAFGAGMLTRRRQQAVKQPGDPRRREDREPWADPKIPTCGDDQ